MSPSPPGSKPARRSAEVYIATIWWGALHIWGSSVGSDALFGSPFFSWLKWLSFAVLATFYVVLKGRVGSRARAVCSTAAGADFFRVTRDDGWLFTSLFVWGIGSEFIQAWSDSHLQEQRGRAICFCSSVPLAKLRISAAFVCVGGYCGHRLAPEYGCVEETKGHGGGEYEGPLPDHQWNHRSNRRSFWCPQCSWGLRVGQGTPARRMFTGGGEEGTSSCMGSGHPWARREIEAFGWCKALKITTFSETSDKLVSSEGYVRHGEVCSAAWSCLLTWRSREQAWRCWVSERWLSLAARSVHWLGTRTIDLLDRVGRHCEMFCPGQPGKLALCSMRLDFWS